MAGHSLFSETIERIRQCRDEGKSLSTIAFEVGVCRRTVQKYWKRSKDQKGRNVQRKSDEYR